MNENDKFTEALSVSEELKLDRDNYRIALSVLTWEQLRDECLKQYDLSGLSLDKYRAEYQKKKDAQDKNRELFTEIRELRQCLDSAERVIANLNTVIDTVKRLISLSAGYTHAMKRTVMTLITDALNRELMDVEFVLYRRDARNGKTGNKDDIDDIPF